MATEPQSDGQIVEGEATTTGGFTPRGSDIVVAVMGVTGAGKSTFISKCVTDPATPAIGHDIESCTQNVGIYTCDYSPDIKVYLIDTPGFDDTTRSDRKVLQDIAFWLGKTYKESIRLNGIIYFHRIIDPRMQGSARKNLFMFKKLCGESALKNVILATTMWEKVDITDGERRESQLISTPEFWGWMTDKGSQIRRHYNTRDSAMDLLRIFVNARTQVALDIQCEMVDAHKTLDQTGAGKTLNNELTAEREKFRREIAELHAELKEAMAARDSEAAEMIRNAQADMQRKIAELEHDKTNLKLTLEAMEAQHGRVGYLEQMMADMKANTQTLEGKIKQLVIGREVASQSINSPPANRATTYQYQDQLNKADVKVRANHHATLTSMANPASKFRRQGLFQQVQKLKGLRPSVRSVTFSPDGRRLASGEGDSFFSNHSGVIQIWEADSQGQFQQVQKLKGLRPSVHSVAFSPDGRRFASGEWGMDDHDGVIQIWEANKQGQFQQVYKLKGLQDVHLVAFSPDGRRFAGCLSSIRALGNGVIQIWEADGLQQVQQLEGLRYHVKSVAFSPDGRRLASGEGESCTDRRGVLQIWEANKQGQFQQVQQLEGLRDNVNSVAFSPDGRRLVSGEDDSFSSRSGVIQIWESDGQGQFQQVQQLKGLRPRIRSVALSPNGRRLASGEGESYNNSSRVIQIWEADSQGQFQQVQQFEGLPYVPSVAFSPDGRRLAGVGGIKLIRNGVIQLWEADGQVGG